MTTPFATSADIVAVWRPLKPEEEVIAPGLIDQASNKLRLAGRRKGVDIDALFASADTVKRDAITAVVVNAVKRVLMNPEAVRQYSETTGPFTESKTIDSAVSAGILYLAPGDLSDIFPTRSPYTSFRLRAGLR